MSDKCSISRRGFMKSAAVAGVACAAPAIIPGSALGADGTVAPSNRIVMCNIGVGSMGTGDMNAFLGKKEVQIVAVCDVDSNHYNSAKQRVDSRYKNTDCKTYKDFRELLDRDDIDAAALALPDHWHAPVAVACARRGLDIFGQKPLARSIKEGRAICDAVQKYGRVWQTGSWQRSVRNFRHAANLVRAGHLGKILKVEVGLPTGGSHAEAVPGKAPANLDWNMWLGPAPWRPYTNFGRSGPHWDWRWILDYSGGQLTDWAGHHIDIAHWSMGRDHTGPSRITPMNVEYPKSGLYNVPMTYKFRLEYAEGADIFVANSQQFPQGVTWYGERGTMYVSRGTFRSNPDSIYKEQIEPGEVRLYESNDHMQNFLDCIKSRELTITPVEAAQRSISAGLLGEIAMITGRTLHWDPKKEEILGDPNASALLGRAYRGPWTL